MEEEQLRMDRVRPTYLEIVKMAFSPSVICCTPSSQPDINQH